MGKCKWEKYARQTAQPGPQINTTVVFVCRELQCKMRVATNVRRSRNREPIICKLVRNVRFRTAFHCKMASSNNPNVVLGPAELHPGPLPTPVSRVWCVGGVRRRTPSM